MNILLIDDHAVLRAGLRQLLAAALPATIHEAPDAPTALASIATTRPDLIILDLGLPGQGGLALLPQLHQANLRVLVLTMHTEPLYARRALDAGAAGYASKNIPPDTLLHAIRTILAGRRYIEPHIAETLAANNLDPTTKLQNLTARDLDILRHLAAGHPISQIATTLNVSYKTIANTTSTIRSKLGVPRTADLIRLAIEMQSR